MKTLIQDIIIRYRFKRNQKQRLKAYKNAYSSNNRYENYF